MLRTDRQSLPLAPPSVTPWGMLLADATVSRVGVLLRNGRRELVDEETLLDPEALATLRRAPVTVRHPRDASGQPVYVTAGNAKQYVVGDVGDVVDTIQIDGVMHLRAPLAVRQAEALSEVHGGVEEISAGYECDDIGPPGVHPIFGPYDVIQRRRRYNHIALVPSGRAGPTVALRADEGEIMEPETAPPEPTGEETETPEPTDEVEMDAAPPAGDPPAPEGDEASKRAKLMIDGWKRLSDAAGVDAADVEGVVSAILSKLTAGQQPPPAPKVDEAEFITYARTRAPLEALARHLKIDSADLKVDALRERCARALRTDVPEGRSADYYQAVIDTTPVVTDATAPWPVKAKAPKVDDKDGAGPSRNFYDQFENPRH